MWEEPKGLQKAPREGTRPQNASPKSRFRCRFWRNRRRRAVEKPGQPGRFRFLRQNCADLTQNISKPQTNPLGDRAGDAPGASGSPPSGARPGFCSWGSPDFGWRHAAAAVLGPIAARTYLALHRAPPKMRGGGPKTSSPPREEPPSPSVGAGGWQMAARKRANRSFLPRAAKTTKTGGSHPKKKGGLGKEEGPRGGQSRLGSGWRPTGFVIARSRPREAEGAPSRVIIPKPSGF